MKGTHFTLKRMRIWHVLTILLPLFHAIFCLDEHAKFTILQTTDIHAWVYGHAGGANDTVSFNAGIAELLSLRNRLAEQASTAGRGFLLFDSGDQVQGTGLSDGAPVPGQNIWELLSEFNYDGLTVGNHDLNDVAAVDWFRSEGRHLFRDAYLTSNVNWTDTSATDNEGFYSGNAVRVISDPVTGLRVLVVGLIYDFELAPSRVKITPPELWATSDVANTLIYDALVESGGPADLVVSLCHIELDNAVVPALQHGLLRTVGIVNSRVRAYFKLHPYVDKTPSLWLMGHSHIWRHGPCPPAEAGAAPSTQCYMVEADSYLWQVATYELDLVRSEANDVWQLSSFPNPDILQLPDGTAGLRMNTDVLAEFQKIPTSNLLDAAGAALAAEIARRRAALGLDDVIACSPRHYSAQGWTGDRDALPRLWMDVVLPASLPGGGRTSLASSEGRQLIWAANVLNLRDQLPAGPITRDTALMIFPFSEEWNIIRDVSGRNLYGAVFEFEDQPTGPSTWDSSPHYVVSERLDRLDPTERYDLVAPNYDSRRFARRLAALLPDGPAPQPEPFVGRNGVRGAGEAFMHFLTHQFSCSPLRAQFAPVRGAIGAGAPVTETPTRRSGATVVAVCSLFSVLLLFLVLSEPVANAVRRRRAENDDFIPSCDIPLISGI